MKKLLLCVMLVQLFPLKIFGESFQSYIKYINKSEDYIVHEQYRNAQKCYDSAFTYWDKPFAIDLCNYMMCANINVDHKAVKTAAARLMSLGCELSFFSTPQYLTEFRKSTEWQSLIKEYPRIRQKFVSRNNWELRSRIEKLFALDQCLRQQDPNYSYLKDSIYKLDKLIESEVIGMLHHKYPNEYDCGIFLDNDTTISSYLPLHIVILHNYVCLSEKDAGNLAKCTFDFTTTLLNAVKKGQMHPQEYAYLNDRSGKFNIGEGYGQDGLLTNINGKIYYNNYLTVFQNKIDSARKEIGLPDLASERKKGCFNVNNRYFVFFRYMGYVHQITGMTFSDKKLKAYFIDSGVNIK